MATLKDIAAKANVDVSIVSRILHKRDYGRASKATRQRIERAAAELGYEPNVLARSLVRQKTDMIGIILPDLYDPAFVRYLEAIDRLLEDRNLQAIPMLSRWNAEREASVLRLARQRLVDGVIAFYYGGSDRAESYQALKNMGIPVVFRTVEETPDNVMFNRVNVDIRAGGYVLTRHLLDNGYRRIGLLGGSSTRDLAIEQRIHGLAEGYTRALQESGIPVDPALVIPCEDDGSDTAQRLRERIRDNEPGFDALLVQSNSKLPGVYQVLAEQGLTMGKDIGVVTVTDSAMCHIAGVSVTVWEQPVEQIAEELVRLLMNSLGESEAPVEKVEMASRLIVRGSSLRTQVLQEK